MGVQGYPQEKVGVFVRRGRGGPLSVLEYSEMDSSMACEINQTTGRLRYCWSNVSPRTLFLIAAEWDFYGVNWRLLLLIPYFHL